MKKMIVTLVAGVVLGSAAYAQSAMDLAISRGICTGRPVAAETLATGQLKVTCRAGEVNPQYASNVVQPAALGGTALTPAAGAALLGAAVLVVVAGDDGTGTTTTSATN